MDISGNPITWPLTKEVLAGLSTKDIVAALKEKLDGEELLLRY
jgi:hypothetical protein